MPAGDPLPAAPFAPSFPGSAWERGLSGGLGVVLAADGVVVKYAKNKLVVKVDGEEKTIPFARGHPHVQGADGKGLKVADYPKHLEAGVKVELEEEGGKVTEVLIKK